MDSPTATVATAAAIVAIVAASVVITAHLYCRIQLRRCDEAMKVQEYRERARRAALQRQGAASVTIQQQQLHHRSKSKKQKVKDNVMAQAARRAAMKRRNDAPITVQQQQQQGLTKKIHTALTADKEQEFQNSSKKKDKGRKASKIKLPEPERFAPRLAPAHIPAELKEVELQDNTKPPAADREGTDDRQAAVANTGIRTDPTSDIPFCQSASQIGATTSSASLGASQESSVSSNGLTMANKEAIVTRDGITTFFHIPDLASSEYATFVMQRLAREFLPIIKRRGYLVFSVSELCCCSDGTKAALGQVRNKKRIKAVLAGGVTEDQCGGYNSTIQFRDDKTMHLIYVRLRDRVNHYKFRSYEKDIVTTMAHELAHCVHQNHSPAFYQLMNEIKKEHADLMASGVVHQDSSAEEQFGFDIYGQSVTRLRY